MTQTLAEGESRIEELAMKYKPQGTTGQAPKRADELTLLLLGLCNAGKSRFIQTHPSLAIVNFDGTPTTHPNPTAELWPGSGRPQSWPAMLDFVADVIQATEEGQTDAPTGIAFDSFNTMLHAAREYAAYHLYEKACARERPPKTPKPISEFNPFDVRNVEGRTVWDLAYQWINRLVVLCQKAGLGVIIPVHLAYEIIELGSGDDMIRIERLAPAVTGNQMATIFTPCDASFVLERIDTVETRSVQKTRKVGGRDRPFTVSEAVPVIQQVLHTRHKDKDLGRYMKGRVGTIPLPESINVGGLGWSEFAEVWNSCSGVDK